MVQLVRLCTPNAGGPGLLTGQGTRSCMPQQRPCKFEQKSPHATTKTWGSQI